MNSNTKRYDEVFKSNIITVPHIKVADTVIYNGGQQVLRENEYTSPFNRIDDVVMVITLQGRFTSCYAGVQKPFENRPLTCSFSYAPYENHHPVPAEQLMETVGIGINKAFFIGLIEDTPDKDVELLLNRVEKKDPFNLTSDRWQVSPTMLLLLQQIRTTTLTGSLKTLYQQSKICELLMHQLSVLKDMERPLVAGALSPKDLEKIKELKLYLDQNFLQAFTLDGLAKMSGLNTFKIKTGFKSTFNMSVFELLRSKRMEHAEKLLNHTGFTVSEVADQMGYEYVQHFSTAFKKHFGRSPRNYKGNFLEAV